MSRQSYFVVLAVAVALAGCSKSATANGWPRYRDPHGNFSISYPPGWKIDAKHDHQALGPDKDIYGVAFTVAPERAAGTNLSDDSYLAIETLPNAPRCVASLFLDNAAGPEMPENGKTGIAWSVARGADAGAGNFYDETVYAALGSKPCIAIRYFVHSTNIGNYDPGTVKAFDEKALTATFDEMRNSFRLH